MKAYKFNFKEVLQELSDDNNKKFITIDGDYVVEVKNEFWGKYIKTTSLQDTYQYQYPLSCLATAQILSNATFITYEHYQKNKYNQKHNQKLKEKWDEVKPGTIIEVVNKYQYKEVIAVYFIKINKDNEFVCSYTKDFDFMDKGLFDKAKLIYDEEFDEFKK